VRPEVCFDEWGPVEVSNDPGSLGNWYTGFHLSNDGISAHDVQIDDFAVGDEVWMAERIARVKRDGQAFSNVSAKSTAQRWNLLGAIHHFHSGSPGFTVGIRATYRDASNNWYESRADLRYIPGRGIGDLRFGPTAHGKLAPCGSVIASAIAGVNVAPPDRKPPGTGGRPRKNQTHAIHAKWIKLDRPRITAGVCDKIAESFFTAELKGINRGTPEHRKVRGRVRQAILRGEQPSAT
jgi:hypothetical protein